jgi:mRNA interferase HigB
VELRIIKWKNVLDHCQSDKKMLKAFERFYEIAEKSEWETPQQIIRTYSNSDLVTCKKQKTSRIVFNVGTNKYRLIVGYYFAPTQTILYVKFVGTHKEYDKVDACKVDMFKRNKI